MTLGSPIDKHLLIWGDLWKSFEGHPANRLELTSPILWHNYYDYGDPVGFDLDEARSWLRRTGWNQHFNFADTADHGFTRYLLPGKAHIDYWQDDDVFAHIFEHVALIRSPYQSSPAPVPADRPFQRVLSWVIPYVLAFALMAAATYFMVTGTHVAQGLQVSSKIVLADVLAIGLLLSGLTVAGRIPRLLRVDRCNWKWWGFSVVTFGWCAVQFYGCRLRHPRS